ncbi:MAG: DUF4115 domain-containing protein [Synechococcaceae cyanobacterium]
MPREPEGQQPSLEELETELAGLRAELDDYQHLIEQTPAIYEETFRHRVHQVALEIRRLLDEQQDLRGRMAQALAPGREPAELPEAPPRRRRWPVLAGVVAAVALTTAMLGTLLRGPRQPAPLAEPAAEVADALPLRLRARGDCWLQVESLDGETILVDTLNAGDERRLPLGDGLRLLVGRPDLLDVAVGGDDFRTFGPIDAIDWVVIRPPTRAEGPS